MPYTKDELDNLAFYQSLTTGDESKYLEALKRRGSPLLKFAINS